MHWNTQVRTVVLCIQMLTITNRETVKAEFIVSVYFSKAASSLVKPWNAELLLQTDWTKYIQIHTFAVGVNFLLSITFAGSLSN